MVKKTPGSARLGIGVPGGGLAHIECERLRLMRSRAAARHATTNTEPSSSSVSRPSHGQLTCAAAVAGNPSTFDQARDALLGDRHSASSRSVASSRIKTWTQFHNLARMADPSLPEAPFPLTRASILSVAALFPPLFSPPFLLAPLFEKFPAEYVCLCMDITSIRALKTVLL